MSGRSRLLALRLQGFKSFAESTTVEFGPGINAVVGPNGSGKSNLVDALRWALGEQGRALRLRRAEDVVFSGSEHRSAVGMADVTLVLDNVDRLLPVDYSIVEISRRLFRSGENEYLLNRGRVRLREIVDLLDAAHLADNAFLFIGQGMVDQALSLRPEERRPLFEDVAGVRRHDRRRRRAIEHLVEAEANLIRVEDVITELRPQVRRLSVQAEQQASRARAIDEFAAAILAAGHARWFDGAAKAIDLATRKAAIELLVSKAATDVEAAEARAIELRRGMSARAEMGDERRSLLDHARARLSAISVQLAAVDAGSAAFERDRQRLQDERDEAEADLARRRDQLAVPVPERDRGRNESLAGIEAALGEAERELATLHTSEDASDAEAGAMARAREARMAERAAASELLERASGAAAEAVAALAEAAAGQAGRDTALAERRAALVAAAALESAAIAATADARAMLEATERDWRSGLEADFAVRASVAAGRATLADLHDRLGEDDAPDLPAPARARAGRRIAEGLDVVPALRLAVEAALGAAIRAHLVDPDTAALLVGERASVVIAESGDEPTIGEASGLLERLRRRRGGLLGDAIRRDPSGAAHRLLARTGWVPDLTDAVDLLPHLRVGWLLATRAGDVVRWDGLVVLGAPDSILERRAASVVLAGEVAQLEARAATVAAELASLDGARIRARVAYEAAREAEAAAAGNRRAREEEERAAARVAERSAREVAWLADQADRRSNEVTRHGAVLAHLGAAEAEPAADRPLTPTSARSSSEGPSGAIRAWETRVAELRARRLRVMTERDRVESQQLAADAQRARIAAAADLDETRIARAEAALAALAESRERSDRAGIELRSELEEAIASEGAAAAVAQDLREADAAARAELAAIEAAAAAARDAHRSAEERLRTVELAEIEARLGLEALREQLLVDVAVLGDEGRALRDSRPDRSPDSADPHAPAEPAWYDVLPIDSMNDRSNGEGEGPDAPNEDSAVRLLDALVVRWALEPPEPPTPTASRLAGLRRRLHEVGSANPLAAAEHEDLRARLAALDGQAVDLRGAIERTRDLITELDALIAGQFQATFRALEGAFDGRFRQLFGGGFARLSLTDPSDLSTTGVEIVARPPGKKPQALAMLSGGERALTAVALLFAMLEVRPVPFCVLDEVDAALDEANIGRFTDALRELAEGIQFIVITHNRGTLEQADALFGVTVRDDAVSRVVSLRLEEARDLARPAELRAHVSDPDLSVATPG